MDPVSIAVTSAAIGGVAGKFVLKEYYEKYLQKMTSTSVGQLIGIYVKDTAKNFCEEK